MNSFVASIMTHPISLALLTGGGDQPYAFGLATSLISEGVTLDVVGSDELDCKEFHSNPRVNFLNLRGSHERNASFATKIRRLSKYYFRLICYAATAKPRIFHILWNNKLELFDRTLLMLYYRFLRKLIVLTLHNVNTGRRDGRDTRFNRLTLRVQYRLAHHIFVHTEKMKSELMQEFGVFESRISVIPFGINNAVPNTSLTTSGARKRLGIREGEKTILFFGNIAPYKGLEYLIAAFREVSARRDDYRLIIVGRPKNCEQYWKAIRETVGDAVGSGRVVVRAEFIPDDETEVYFKAADVLVLPYTHIYQSGVLSLGYSFGLPVLASDVGSLRDEIVEGRTGLVFRPEDPVDLASVIENYFASDLFVNLSSRRQDIRDYAMERYSWNIVAEMTVGVYASLLSSEGAANRDASTASFHLKDASERVGIDAEDKV